MASANTRRRQAATQPPAPPAAAMTRVQITIEGGVERYDAAGKIVEAKALAERPIPVVAMSAAAFGEQMAELTEQLMALWPPAAEGETPDPPGPDA